MASTQEPTLSVIITNYNYAGFVATAIESLLSQSPDIEIIVVDDCSKDNSREIISQFTDRVTCVFQEQNMGHGGGFNAGFEKATGTLVMFLDADDFMLPGAADIILANYDPDIAMYHYRMRYADEKGNLSGLHPPLEMPLADGDISAKLRHDGRYNGTITSGLVYSRAALEKVMPMDSEAYRQGGDGYLSAVVPLYGACASFDDPISGYRLHDQQHSKFQKAYAKRARWRLKHDQDRYQSIAFHANHLGLPVDADLGARDPGNLHERLVSMLYEPELHPHPGDTLAGLSAQAQRLALSQQSGFGKLISRIWWMTFRFSPKPMKRMLMEWKIEPNARPKWLQSFGRFLRTRFNVIAR